MIIGIILIGILFLLVSFNKYKSWNNPYTVFNAIWVVIGILIAKGNKFVDEPSATAQLIVLIGVIAFNSSLFFPKFVIGDSTKTSYTTIDYSINTKKVYYLSWIIVILSIFSAKDAIQAVMAGADFSTIRNEYYTISSTESVYMYYLRNYLISPMRYAIIIATIIAFYKKLNKRTGLLINSIILVFFQAITSGGRYVLMNTFFMFLCGMLLFGKKYKFNRRQKFLFILLSIVIAYGIIYLTNDRATHQTADMTVLERLVTTIYQYFAGSVTYLGRVIETSPEIIGSTYGVNSIAGFITPIFAFLAFVNLLPYPKIFNVIGLYATQVLKIGLSTYFNAMPTIFGYFYIDGGLILTFIETAIFGYVCKRLYERASKGDLLFIAWYILMFVQICNVSTRWFFFASEYCLAFIYLRLLIHRTPHYLAGCQIVS